MYLTDFVYDGVKLSTLGYIVGSAVTSNNDSASAGSKLELQTVTNRANNMTQIINTQYNEPITVTFDIIKHACNATAAEIVEDIEIPFMMQWLNRTQYCKFFPIYNDLSLQDVYFMGTFTEINTIQLGGNVVGFTVTFTANAPYGFGDYDDIEVEFDGHAGIYYYDQSDEYGDHCPNKIIITTREAGNYMFRIQHIYDDQVDDAGQTARINNCVAGEVITLDCIHKIITSSETHANLYNDFNFIFPKIRKTYRSSKNSFYTTKPCHVQVIYHPIKKVGIVV